MAVLAKLTNLNISNNCIKNIFPLIGLKRLAELDASENNIANISPLSYLFVSSLISLKCSNQHLNASNFKKVELVGFRGKSLQKINLKNTKICNNSYLLEFYDEFHSDADKWAHKFGCFSGIIEIENS